MRRFFLIALTAGLLSPTAVNAWGRYSSMYEAEKACEKWVGKSSRKSCMREDATKQILGIHNINNDWSNFKVKKYFRY